MDHVRRMNVLGRVNGHSSNFNDHPSYSNTNLSRGKNSTLPRAQLVLFLHFPENRPTLNALESCVDVCIRYLRFVNKM